MLSEIRVKNVALLEDVRVEFGDGFNVVTGETGAGKSILIESMKMALGEKVPLALVPQEEPASVEIVCEVGGETEEISVPLSEAGIDVSDFLILRRVVHPTGRTRSFVNDASVTGGLLSHVTSSLVNVLGQHAIQKIFGAKNATNVLDSFAGNEKLLREYRDAYREWRATGREMDLLREELPHLEGKVAWLDESIRELEGAGVYPGEEAEIESELPVLKNAAKIREALAKVSDLLSQEEVSVLSLLQKSADTLESASQFDERVGELLKRLREHLVGLADISHDLVSRVNDVPLDDERYEALAERLSLIRRLSRKYGAYPDELEGRLSELKREREKLSRISEELEEVRVRERKLGEKVRELGRSLTRKRAEAIQDLEEAVKGELSELDLEKAVFRVVLSPNERGEAAPYGMERGEFLFSPTEEVEPGPLVRIASGGELSRVMLAIHNSVAGKGDFRTFIFDEVDAGIGGKVAEKVGEKLKRLSRSAQVICVTHLPQIAALADHHVKVTKEDVGGKTVTRVDVLGENERAREIARMVSGEEVSPEALKYAETLLKRGAR